MRSVYSGVGVGKKKYILEGRGGDKSGVIYMHHFYV